MTQPESPSKEISIDENSLNEEDKEILEFGKDINVTRSLFDYIARKMGQRNYIARNPIDNDI